MQSVHAQPGDAPFCDPETVELAQNEKAVITYQPTQSGTTFVMPELAISKRPETTYQVDKDGSKQYEGEIPPTDIDDSSTTFWPPWEFTRTLKVTVRNFSTSTRVYHVQAKGWETTDPPSTWGSQ